MRKTLMNLNVVFLGIQCCFTLWWLGFQYAKGSGLFDGFVFLLAPVVFLVVSKSLLREWEYVKVRTFGIWGALIIGWAAFLLGFTISRADDSVGFDTVDYVYLITVIVLSVISAAFCFWSVVIAKGEKQKYT